MNPMQMYSMPLLQRIPVLIGDRKKIFYSVTINSIFADTNERI